MFSSVLSWRWHSFTLARSSCTRRKQQDSATIPSVAHCQALWWTPPLLQGRHGFGGFSSGLNNPVITCCFPHLLVVNKFLRFWPSQTDWNWSKLTEIDWNWLKLIECVCVWNRSKWIEGGKPTEIAENYLRQFRMEGCYEKTPNCDSVFICFLCVCVFCARALVLKEVMPGRKTGVTVRRLECPSSKHLNLVFCLHLPLGHKIDLSPGQPYAIRNASDIKVPLGRKAWHTS